jgi:DNA-binding MarR family transcriptional regulator
MNSKLISSPSDRAARTALKRYTLLNFLKSNYYTTADIAGLLLGISSRQGVHSTLVSMERDGLLRRETVEANSRRWTLWGITPHGQAMAFDPDKNEEPESKYFEAGRVGLSVLAHTLELQRLSIVAERAGWTDWCFCDRLGKWQAGQSRPDALVTSPAGVIFALECERTIKTFKRYQTVLGDRLQAAKRGDFAHCVWLCPTREQAKRLHAIILAIKELNVAGTVVQVQDRHRAILHFAAFEDFPNIKYS